MYTQRWLPLIIHVFVYRAVTQSLYGITFGKTSLGSPKLTSKAIWFLTKASLKRGLRGYIHNTEQNLKSYPPFQSDSTGKSPSSLYLKDFKFLPRPHSLVGPFSPAGILPQKTDRRQTLTHKEVQDQSFLPPSWNKPSRPLQFCFSAHYSDWFSIRKARNWAGLN